jgi:hypothetical protein
MTMYRPRLTARSSLRFGSVLSLILASLACQLSLAFAASSSSRPAPPAPNPSLAGKAELWGDNPTAMESYAHFQDKTWGWFFSPNPNLAGRTNRPSSFASWSDWNGFSPKRIRQVLLDLAGMQTWSTSPGDLARLVAAYLRWPPELSAVFQGSTSLPTNTCNLFVGDALYLDGLQTIGPGEKYCDALSIYKGQLTQYVRVDSIDVERGDIAAWSYGHVEIVTQRENQVFFCSRGGFRPPIGGQKCGTTDGGQRRTDDPDLRVFRKRSFAGSIAGLLYVDYNGNGLRDGDDYGNLDVTWAAGCGLFFYSNCQSPRHVYLYRDDGDNLYTADTDPFVATTATDVTTGRFIFEEVVAGRYWINVSSSPGPPGAGTPCVLYSLVPGSSANLDLPCAVLVG